MKPVQNEAIFWRKLGLILIISLSFSTLLLPTQVFSHNTSQIIEITSDSFIPSSITVDQNTTLIFLNKDKKDHWPASNVHPTHEIYSEFDSREPIGPGKSWSFKPKVGVWKYHDHLFPHIRGTIKAIDEEGKEINIEQKEESPKTTFIEKIKSAISEIWLKLKSILHPKNKPEESLNLNMDNFDKLSQNMQTEALTNFAKNKGSDKAWQFLQDTFKNQGGSSGNIHDLAHLVGGLIYELKGFEGIGICTSEFAFGCYHGFLDKAFAKNLDRLLDAENACLKLSVESNKSIEILTGPVASCIHGIGHGVASYYLVSDLKKSLYTCRELISGEEYCFDGVFMEFVRSAPITFFKKEDPFYPCDDLEKGFGYAYSFACGRNQPTLLMSRFNLGFDEVIKTCSNSDSNPFKSACFDALGFIVAKSGDTEKIITNCQKIPDSKYVLSCVKAAAGELVFQDVPNWQEKAPEVCNKLLEGQNECLEYVNKIINEYGKQLKKKFRYLKTGEDENSYIREQLKICFDTAGKDGCYKEVAKVLYQQMGLSKTLGLLKANEEYSEVYARCHEVTHYLSRFEYEKQKSIQKAYAQCDSTCHGGCYHGTLEAYLKEKNLTGVELDNHFPTICGQKQDYQKPLEYNECLHGLGHAAMFVTDMELMQSLKLCDNLPQQFQKERCYSGVFMENSSSSTSFDHASIYIKKDDPFYPCNTLEEKYLPLCWQYQSSYFSIINNQDWVKVSRMCLKIPDKYQDLCFRTIGTNQVGFTQSLLTMKKDCDLMPTPNFQNICVSGVISSFAYRFVGDIQKMIDFCSIVEPHTKEICYKQIGTALLDWNTDKGVAKKYCGSINSSEGSSWCTSAVDAN